MQWWSELWYNDDDDDVLPLCLPKESEWEELEVEVWREDWRTRHDTAAVAVCVSVFQGLT